MRHKAYGLVAAASALSLIGSGLAHADNVVNNVEASGNGTITAGGSTTISYKINGTGGDGQSGCNASDGSPATVTITPPAGVTASPSSLQFATCGDFKNVTFSSSSVGSYSIRHGVSDTGIGTYSNQADWTLTVNAAASSTVDQATLNVVAPASGVYGSSATLSSTGGSGSGTVTYEGSGTACAVSGAQLSITAGTGTCNVRAHKAASTGYNAATSAWADVTASTKAVTGSFTADDKVYDGGTTATVTSRSLNGAIAGDTVQLDGGTATFADKHVANGKTVTLTGAGLTGGAAGNYSLTSVGTATANITAKAVTGSFTVADKVYDGNTNATITGGSLTGAIATDDVALDISSASASFDSPSVGSAKTVTGAGFALSGGDAGNYSLTMGTATANVTYAFGGWQQPVVSLPTRNTVKAGRAVPIRFSLGGDHGLRIFNNSTATVAGGPKVAVVTCNSAATDPVDETLTAGNSNLSYDSTSSQYTYVWKTDTAWAGKCLRLALNLNDGSTHQIEFQATK